MKKKIISISEFFIFVFPAFVLIMMSSNIPFLMNIYYSLFDWNGVSKNMDFVGMQNFVRIFTGDRTFLNALLFTFRFTAIFVTIVNVLSILIAVALSRNSIISSIGRAFYFIPNIIGLIAISLIWTFIFGPGFKILYTLTSNMLFDLSWMGDPKYVFYTLVFISVWQTAGFYSLIYIAGINGVPDEVLEAAEIDGASSIRKFTNVTFPLIMPAVAICSVLSVNYSLNLFEIILAFTRGGPAGKTKTAVFDIYQEAFTRYNFGLATAKSLVLFIIVLIFVILQFRLLKSREVEL